MPQHDKIFRQLILALMLCASAVALAWAQEFPVEVPDIATAPLAELEALVARDEAELAALRSRVAQVDSELIKEKTFDIEAALAEARRQMQDALTGSGRSSENPAICRT